MASTEIDDERWHDGVPYEVAALAEVDPPERAEIERWLVGRADRDWREIDALVALGTPTARAAVVAQLRSGSIEQRLAAARALPPDPAVEPDREAAIVAGLAEASVLSGLTTALDLAATHRSPAVIHALFRAALRDDRQVAIHAAALLAFIHGHAREAFDWNRRAFYLEFGEADPNVRRDAFRRLCAECGVDPAGYIGEGTVG